MRLSNCHNKIKHAESLAYYTKIKNYIETEAEQKCAGGIGGCIMNPIHYMCRAGLRLANVGSVNSSGGQAKIKFDFVGKLIFLGLALKYFN